MAPSGPPERGPLARLARDTLCPACGQPLRDPVLLPCNHSCCPPLPAPDRRHPPPQAPAPPSAAPRCHRAAAPHRLRTPVALAVETRIAQRLTRASPRPPGAPSAAAWGPSSEPTPLLPPPAPHPLRSHLKGGGPPPSPSPPPLTPQ
ncbi:uncharacterized protein AAGF69_015212 [Amazona ochrocephala]